MEELPRIVTRKQAIAYSVVAFNTLKSSANEITEKLLADEIPTIMQLYNKNKIVKESERVLRK